MDHHALWINRDDTDIMINCNDGGAALTLNGGKTWSTQFNRLPELSRPQPIKRWR